jgi:ADP-ribosylglycohydrolase
MPLYSVAEAARRLGIDPSLVRAYIRQGRIESERAEPPYVISEASLARFERDRPVRGRPKRTPEAGGGGRKTMNRELSLADRLKGAVWGHLVGDAVGVPYEFRPGPILDVRWGQAGTHGQPPGTWSDDGGLMLALLDSLMTTGFDLEDQGRRAVAWMDGPDYKPRPLFDIGVGTSQALARVRSGVPAASAGGRDESDNGNGSLMRILPIALVGVGLPPSDVVLQACLASGVTHGHPRSLAVCAVYCLLVGAILDGEADREAALARAFAAADSFLDTDPRRELGLMRDFEGRSGSGYVVDCFFSAWDAFRAASSYRECVERAVGFGQDTDTTAAVAGGLAGAYWGVDGIPMRWLLGMRGGEIVKPLIVKLLAAAAATQRP